MNRPTASTITDDQLDALYAELDRLRVQKTPSARQEAAGGPQRAPGGSRAAGVAERPRERRTAAQAGAERRDWHAAAIEHLRDTGGVYGIDDAERDRIAAAVMAVADAELDAERLWSARLRQQHDDDVRKIQQLRAAEVAIARVRQMARAWQERLPETIRTATAVDAILTALEGQQQEAAQ